jgi:2-haloacid dehalogenase
MATIKNIVFDLGGVLVDWNPDYVYKKIFNNDESRMRWFYQNICTSDWNEEQDAGRTLAEGTELLLKKFPEQEENIRAYYGRWEEMLGGPIEGTVHILQTFPIALARYDFLNWFDGRLVSGEEKTRKPFKKIYELLINKFSIDPSRSIYTDDNLRNLQPAADLGFHTIHFQSPDQFGNELKKLGIEID